MNPHHHEKYIMLATVFGFTAQLLRRKNWLQSMLANLNFVACLN
jgi:hypothetical protein